MSSGSLAAFRRTVTVNWPNSTAAQAKELLLKTARAGHAEIMSEQSARTGSLPTWEAYANTPGNKNLDSVKLPGPIVYNYFYQTEVIEYTLERLRANSPARSGKYRDAHQVYIGGSPSSSREFKPGQEVIISNTVPYSRRLEVGLTQAGRPFVVQVPPRIYQRTADEVRAKYGRTVKVTYTFVSLGGGEGVPAIILEQLT